ncbi:hypothetical protein NKI09_04880 [Mesorhizobium sp. M0757]|uniref:hypothetical protein n=1 Tax=Mesorhizobium sp. M0757 TaxID=2956993 RepID=UPI00333D3073
MNFNALRFAGVEPDILVEFDCNGHEAGYVSAGLGISITNEIIAREYAAFHLGIRPVELSALYHYVAIWQKLRFRRRQLRESNSTPDVVLTADGIDNGEATMSRCCLRRV